jgi:hypothetical protein
MRLMTLHTVFGRGLMNSDTAGGRLHCIVALGAQATGIRVLENDSRLFARPAHRVACKTANLHGSMNYLALRLGGMAVQATRLAYALLERNRVFDGGQLRRGRQNQEHNGQPSEGRRGTTAEH